MTSLHVLDPGLQTSVQDLGRPGHGHLGVALSGAADPLSLRLGNRLLRNPDGAAALEVTLRGGAFAVRGSIWMVLAGAPIEARLERAGPHPLPVRRGRPFEAPDGSVLWLGASAWGARAYVCVAGGLDVRPVLGSASVHVASGIGGAPLCAGDEVQIARQERVRPFVALGAAALEHLDAAPPPSLLRATDGTHAARFDPSERARFWSGAFQVSAACDRMGVRLRGPAVVPPGDGTLLSEGVPLGAVQVPRAGEAILLLPDGPPTGGYAVIASVIGADLHLLGQLRPHQRVGFRHVSLEEARAAHVERERALDLLVERA